LRINKVTYISFVHDFSQSHVLSNRLYNRLDNLLYRVNGV